MNARQSRFLRRIATALGANPRSVKRVWRTTPRNVKPATKAWLAGVAADAIKRNAVAAK